MSKVRIWQVVFWRPTDPGISPSDYSFAADPTHVIAMNPKEAIKRALWKRRNESYCRLQDIIDVKLVAEGD